MVKSDNNSNKSLKSTYLCLYAMVLSPDLHYGEFPTHPGPAADPCNEIYSIIFKYLHFHAKIFIIPSSFEKYSPSQLSSSSPHGEVSVIGQSSIPSQTCFYTFLEIGRFHFSFQSIFNILELY